jgi:hypothetical protein
MERALTATRNKQLTAFSWATYCEWSYALPFHNRSLKQLSKDCWHLVGALGSAIWPHRHSILDRQLLKETTILRFPTSWLDFSQVFGWHYFNSFGNFRVFTMQILVSGPEEQAVYSGHAFHPIFPMLPPIPMKLWKAPESATPLRKGHHEDQGALKTGQGQSCGEVQIGVSL